MPAFTKQYEEDVNDEEKAESPEDIYSNMHLHIMEAAKIQAQEKIENKQKVLEEVKEKLESNGKIN